MRNEDGDGGDGEGGGVGSEEWLSKVRVEPAAIQYSNAGAPTKRESRFGDCERPVPARQRQAGRLESQREKSREERQIVSESERVREHVCFA